jgi:hypothetical protein
MKIYKFLFLCTSEVVSKQLSNLPIPTIRIGLSTQTDKDPHVDRLYSHNVLGSNSSLDNLSPSLKYLHIDM